MNDDEKDHGKVFSEKMNLLLSLHKVAEMTAEVIPAFEN